MSFSSTTDEFFLHYTALEQGYLHYGDGLYLSRYPYVVVELSETDIADGDGVGVHLECGGLVPEQ